MAIAIRAHAPKALFATLLAIFVGLFFLGRAAQIWLPFWIVGTLGSATYAIVTAIPPLRNPTAYWQSKGLRGTAETTALIAVAAYTLWISQGHLLDELGRL
ncbi:MAG: hypothetical protein ACTSX7_20630 [Alphaproteobacteria bacterium]